MMRKTQLFIGIVLPAILLLGVLLRVSYLEEVVEQPDFTHPLLDHLYHDYWAKLIAFGEAALPPGTADPRIERSPYLRPPGYPYFLSGIYRLFGTDPMVPRAVQMVIGLLTAGLGYLFARQWFERPVALLFALLMSTSWVFIYYEGRLHAPSLLVTLSVLLIYLLSRLIGSYRRRTALFAGIALGVFALVRPNVLTYAAFVVPWFYVVARVQGVRERFPAVACVFLLGAACTVAPATLRNWRASGERVLISANGGINLFFGNHEGSKGVAAYHKDVGAWSCFDYPRVVKDLEVKLGQTVTYGGASSYFARRAFDFMKGHPKEALALTLRKTLLLWGPSEVVSYSDLSKERRQSRVLRNLPMGFPLALSLALTGVGLFLNENRRARREGDGEKSARRTQQLLVVALIIGFVVVYSTTLIVFIVSSRYRVPLLPFLFLGAAFALHRFWLMGVTRDWDSLKGWGAALVLIYMGTSINVIGHIDRPGAWHMHQALAFAHAEDWKAAYDELEKGLVLDPSNPELLSAMAYNLSLQGRLAEAEAHFRKALQRDPRYVKALVGLAKLAARQGRMQEAHEHLVRALDISPNHDEALTCIGGVLALAGETTKAIERFEAALAVNPYREEAHTALGDLLRHSGRLDEARIHFEKAIALNPESAVARDGLNSLSAPVEGPP